MKIVIDIPEAVYDQICREKLDGIMARAIRCGRPLPKGHGRLITACSHFSQSKQTNADRIRAMTDEELAEWVSDMHNTLTCPNGGAISCNPSCTRCWLDWLKQEVEE